jgi:hypothetical protein
MLYKLWSRVVTCVLHDFAEKHHALSPMQAGFRAKCRTSDQLQLVVMALEDARLSAQDVYAPLVDFTQVPIQYDAGLVYSFPPQLQWEMFTIKHRLWRHAPRRNEVVMSIWCTFNIINNDKLLQVARSSSRAARHQPFRRAGEQNPNTLIKN